MTLAKTYWLIGASEGLGRSLAQLLDKAGVTLVLSARNQDRLNALENALGGAHIVVPLDLRDSESVRQAAERLPDVDGVIFMAGAYEPMKAQDFDPDVAEMVADVNFMGAIRALGHVVPRMAHRGAGHIVIIGSLAGFRGLPGAIGYGASKAALMHLAENLRVDLRRLGVKVQLINPGFIKTRLTDKNEFDMPSIMDADTAADHVLRAMKGNRFSTSFPRGFAAFFRLSKFIPQWIYDRIL